MSSTNSSFGKRLHGICCFKNRDKNRIQWYRVLTSGWSDFFFYRKNSFFVFFSIEMAYGRTDMNKIFISNVQTIQFRSIYYSKFIYTQHVDCSSRTHAHTSHTHTEYLSSVTAFAVSEIETRTEDNGTMFEPHDVRIFFFYCKHSFFFSIFDGNGWWINKNKWKLYFERLNNSISFNLSFDIHIHTTLLTVGLAHMHIRHTHREYLSSHTTETAFSRAALMIR